MIVVFPEPRKPESTVTGRSLAAFLDLEELYLKVLLAFCISLLIVLWIGLLINLINRKIVFDKQFCTIFLSLFLIHHISSETPLCL